MPDPERGSAAPGPDLGDELFGGSGDPASTGPIRAVAERSVQPRVPPPACRFPLRRPGWRMVASLALLTALAVAGLWAVSGPDFIAGRAIPEAAPPLVRTVPGVDLVERATRTDVDCAAHSYGQVQQFMAANPCISLRRALYTGTSSGEPVVVAVATVVMATEQKAADLQALAYVDGTGNVSDLLREGVTVEGVPGHLRNASYAAQRRGAVLVIVEAAAVSGAERPLDSLAAAALTLGG